MAPQKQHMFYGVLVTLTVLLLLLAQYLLMDTFKSAAAQLASTRVDLTDVKRVADGRRAMVEKYKTFELAASNPNRPEQLYPVNALELYSVIDKALKDNSIEHTNKSSSSATTPGGIFQLDITFNGPYYAIMKALADIRASEYVMRVSDFNITAQTEGRVTGTMTILSRAQS
jgi:hypothetical protein